MRILLLNQDWFNEEFRAHGHEVISCGTASHLDCVLPTPCLHIQTILSEHLHGFSPDVILWHDNSAPLVIMGLDEIDIPTIAYSVDTHHHAHTHRYLAHIFDLCYIAQKDYLPLFHEIGAQAEWLPLYASRYVEASTAKEHGAVFVGNLNVQLNPERVRFFDALVKKVPVLTMTGEFWNIFPFSEIVINQTVKGDLNFRVFEAMMCGALLLTEHAGNGLLELFQDGVHLVTYEKNNVEEAAAKIQALLANIARTREIAAAGRDEILRTHLPEHRAQVLLEAMKGLKKRQSPMKHFSNVLTFSVASRVLEGIDSASCAKSLVAAMKSLEEGVAEGEAWTPNCILEAIYACFRYDQVFVSQAGFQMLLTLADTYPHVTDFALAKVRGLLNAGDYPGASAIASGYFQEEPAKVFKEAETFITSLLSSSKLLSFRI